MSIKEEREGFAHKSERKKAELIEDCCDSMTGNKGFKGIFTEKFSFSHHNWHLPHDSVDYSKSAKHSV